MLHQGRYPGVTQRTLKEAREPRRPRRPDRRSLTVRRDWTGGRITALVIGALLVLVSLALLGGGGTGLWADLTQREAGYVTTGVHEFSTSGSSAGCIRRVCSARFGSGLRQ
jgi:hypothetical protein